MYHSELAFQLAAYFLLKEGGSMSALKLMKLMYLTDREYLIKYGWLLTGDVYISFPHGPALSQTLNSLLGLDNNWNEMIEGIRDYSVELKNPNLSVIHPDCLSKASRQIMDAFMRSMGI